MDLSNFKTDQSKEIEGTWVQVGEDAKVLIARLGNSQYSKYLREISKPYRAMSRAGVLEIEVVEDLTRKAMAKHVLLGWEGIAENGVEVEYSTDKAYEFLTNYRAFYEMIESLAADITMFRGDAVDEEVEQLGKSPDGSSNTEKSNSS